MFSRVAFCLVVTAAFLAAQTMIVNNLPGTFVDLSTTGGTAITGVSNDSEHLIVTTIGNALFPSGNVLVGNDGVVLAGAVSGDINFGNVQLLFTGLPNGLPAGTTTALFPFWDDLVAGFSAPNSTIYWQEVNGVLYIMWKNEQHYPSTTTGITFEVQVFAPTSCGSTSIIKYVYQDTSFAPGGSYENGSSATIGYARPSGSPFNTVQWSYNAPWVPTGTVLTISGTAPITGEFAFGISSPAGPGSLRIDIADCGGPSTTYFIPVTFSAGIFPNGWVYGLDIPFPALFNVWNSGPPFTGPLPATIGTLTGLPNGLQFWMAGIGLNAANSPTGKYALWTYVIP